MAAEFICRIEKAVGETRAEVLHRGKPIEFYLRRDSAAAMPRPGEVFAGRITKLDKPMMAAFIDLGGYDGLLRFTMAPGAPRLNEGQMVQVEILREAETGKAALVKFIALSDTAKPAKEKSVPLKYMIRARFENVKFEEGDIGGIDYACTEEIKLRTGGYIYIEHTRAGAMIDIDTAGAPKVKVSMAAAREIARQVRLRGIGGLIVIDFPNFRGKKDRADVWQTLVDCFAHDLNSVKIAPFSRFDTVELTRARSGQTLDQIMNTRSGQPTAETTALQGLRRLVREGRVDGGARLVLALPQTAYDWLTADHIDWKTPLTAQIGARFRVEAGASIDVFKDAS